VSTTPTAPEAGRAPRAWIVSPWWDLAYVVITPVLIVPVVLIVVRYWLSPEQVSLGVIAFASLGHHLPGFMRAYGDQELFRRYRLRFLLMPLLVFALALLFTPPSVIANSLGLPWSHLHGLELILLVWGTWHGLMQIYGFMRIYDVRVGVHDVWSARLDHWLCLAVFAAGVVFSDARVFGVANAMWQAGLPLFGPNWIEWARLLVAAAGLGVLAAYLFHQLRRWHSGKVIAWPKLLLIGTTGWFYWYSGRLSTNLLIGLAMFEIFHAVQYNAIVWVYNQRLFRRAGDQFGALGFLFRQRWSMLGLYLAAIAAYSSIRFFSVDASGYVFRSDLANVHQWLMALFVTSSFMHFYFDGFIWKVSERDTQQNLVEQPNLAAVFQYHVPGLVHASKWAVLFAIAGGLLWSERARQPRWQELEAQRHAALAALTPNLPECQMLVCRRALSQGETETALVNARRALELRPRSHTVRAELALALVQSGQLEAAQQQLEQAIHLAPKHWQHHCDLGLVLADLGELERAEDSFRRAVQLRPDFAEPRELLIDFYLRQNRDEQAAGQIAELKQLLPNSITARLGQIVLLGKQDQNEEAIRLAQDLAAEWPDNWRVQLTLGTLLNAAGQNHQALVALRNARTLHTGSTEVDYQLGLAHFHLGEMTDAVQLLREALRREPDHFAAQLLLGNSYLTQGKLELTLQAYEHCYQLDPNHAQLCANFGALLSQQGQLVRAESVYRGGVEANPDSGPLCYNLGLQLWQQGEQDEARKLIHHAEQLGVAISPEVRAAILP